MVDGRVLAGLDVGGIVKPAKWHDSGVLKSDGVINVLTGLEINNTGWRRIDYELMFIPLNTASLKFLMAIGTTGIGSVTKYTSGNNVGLKIAATLPGIGDTPIYSRTNSGELTYSNPPNNGWKYVALEGQPWLMFNLNEDPYEMANMAYNTKFRAERKRLQDRLAQWIADTGDTFALPVI